VEVFVVKSSGKGESLSFIEELASGLNTPFFTGCLTSQYLLYSNFSGSS